MARIPMRGYMDYAWMGEPISRAEFQEKMKFSDAEMADLEMEDCGQHHPGMTCGEWNDRKCRHCEHDWGAHSDSRFVCCDCEESDLPGYQHIFIAA